MRQLQVPNPRTSPLNEFRTELDRFFDDFWGLGNRVPATARQEVEWSPSVDIREAQDHFLISLDVPGIPQDQLKIEVHDRRLGVSGERKSEASGETDDRFYTERSFGRFERSFTLPENADADRLEAKYENGVLQIFVPKAEAAKPREIKIQSGLNTGFGSPSNEKH